MQDKDKTVTEQAQTASRQKQPYERPEIIDYGSVLDLTRGAGSRPTFDMMTGSRRTVN